MPQWWRDGSADRQPGAPTAAVRQILRKLCDGAQPPKQHTHMHTHRDSFQRGDGHSECLCSWNHEKINNYFSPSADSPEV